MQPNELMGVDQCTVIDTAQPGDYLPISQVEVCELSDRGPFGIAKAFLLLGVSAMGFVQFFS
jgi:hypothetical protein